MTEAANRLLKDFSEELANIYCYPIDKDGRGPWIVLDSRKADWDVGIPGDPVSGTEHVEKQAAEMERARYLITWLDERRARQPRPLFRRNNDS